MSTAAFDELLQWLQDHDGHEVYMEIGTPSGPKHPTDAIALATHVTLRGFRSATNVEYPDPMAVMVSLTNERDRLYLEPDRIERIAIHPTAGVKIWFDGGFYVAMS